MNQMKKRADLEYDEISYGVIPIIHTPYDGIYICMVHHIKGDHWSFPKGHAIGMEEPHITAERELMEETKLKIQSWLPIAPIEEKYIFFRGDKRVQKCVIYYYAEVELQNGLFPLVDFCRQELQNAYFMPITELEKRATFPEMKKIALTVYQNILS